MRGGKRLAFWRDFHIDKLALYPRQRKADIAALHLTDRQISEPFAIGVFIFALHLKMHGADHDKMPPTNKNKINSKEADNDGFVVQAKGVWIQNTYQNQGNEQHNGARQNTAKQPKAQREPISF